MAATAAARRVGRSFILWKAQVGWPRAGRCDAALAHRPEDCHEAGKDEDDEKRNRQRLGDINLKLQLAEPLGGVRHGSLPPETLVRPARFSDRDHRNENNSSSEKRQQRPIGIEKVPPRPLWCGSGLSSRFIEAAVAPTARAHPRPPRRPVDHNNRQWLLADPPQARRPNHVRLDRRPWNPPRREESPTLHPE